MKLLAVLTLTAACLLAPALAAAPDDSALAHLRAGHPRLLFTDDQLASAVAAAKTDPFRAALHQRIIEAATAELNRPTVKHVLIGPRLLDQSRTCLGRVLTLSMAYRLTGDAKYAERALVELRAAAAFPDWNPSHFLDVAELSLAFGIGYDWLHGYMKPADREIVRRALLDRALVFARDAYAPGGPKNKQLWFVTAHHNWNQVCNAGLLAGALALADEEPELARVVIEGARKSLPGAMGAYEPDGAYPEGPGYWGYGTSFNVIAIALCESALGTDLGLAAQPAFDLTAWYRLHVQAPAGLAFNYADGGAKLGAQAEYSWLALRYKNASALAHSRELLKQGLASGRGGRSGDRLFALHAVWYPTEPATTPAPAPLDARFRGPAELAVFRSAWADPRALFVGFKAGGNAVNHSHLDLGSFVLDADGIRWAEDLGPDNYNLPGYFGKERWSYYRLNNLSHNTLTPDGKLQAPKAVAPITAYASTPARAFAVADLTPAYPGAATRLSRGIAMLDRARVLVQDEAQGVKAGSKWTWRLVTGAKVTIDDPRHASLTKDGRTLRIEVLAPASVRMASHPATPLTEKEAQNKGFTVLEIEYATEGANAQMAVLLTPAGDHWPAALPLPTVTPLASWK